MTAWIRIRIQIQNPAELLTKLALMALAESMRTLSLGGMVLPV